MAWIMKLEDMAQETKSKTTRSAESRPLYL